MHKQLKIYTIIFFALFFLFSAMPARASTITVNSLLDDGDGTCTSKCTFRDAITNSASSDTITFSVTGSIVLTQGSMAIDHSLTITGPGANLLSIDFDVSGAELDHNSGTLNISNLTFTNNINNISINEASDGTLNLSNVAVTNNSYEALFISTSNASINVSNSTFSNNTDSGGGSAIYFDDVGGTLTITNSTFSNNSAPGGGGGAIFVANGTVSITNSTFTDNSATGPHGGAIDISPDSHDTLTITNSTFSNNSAPGGYGGAIESGSASVVITNSTFVGNSADYGGAIDNDYGSMTITNSTFSGNTATTHGGAIMNFAPITFINSILSGTDNCVNDGGTLTSLGHNIDSGTSCGFAETGDLSSTDPLLGALADNDGPVQTMALLTGSPALDTASDADAPATDARGITRPQGSHSDIGAYELEVVVATPVVHHGVTSGGYASHPIPFITTTPNNTPPTDCLSTYQFSPTTGQACPTSTTYNFGLLTLEQGNTGNTVKDLQTFLNNTLHLSLVVDGVFGPKTKAAVILFQKAHNLVPDGIVGPKTRGKMLAS